MGNINNDGTVFPAAFIVHARVIKWPLSADATPSHFDSQCRTIFSAVFELW